MSATTRSLLDIALQRAGIPKKLPIPAPRPQSRPNVAPKQPIPDEMLDVPYSELPYIGEQQVRPPEAPPPNPEALRTGETAPGYGREPIPSAYEDRINKLPLPQFVKDKAIKFRRALTPVTPLEKKGFETAQDYFGKRYGVDAEINQRFKDFRKQYPSRQAQEDMMFFRQGTRNPYVKGDTIEGPKTRLNQQEKIFATEEADRLFEEQRKLINDSPYMNDINPREFLEHVYLPGIYSGNVKKALDKLPKGFATRNPFANKKTYTSYVEALEKAGLVPKFRSIFDLMEHQQKFINQIISNNELIGSLKAMEQKSGVKLIVKNLNPEIYKEAKQAGYVPFYDPYLRRIPVGKSKDGAIKWGQSDAPALVEPNLAPSMKKIFSESPFKPKSPLAKTYDSVNNALKSIAPNLSFFHAISLGEEVLGLKGPKIFNLHKLPEGFRHTSKVMGDPKLLKKYIDAMGPLTHHAQESASFLDRQLTDLINKGDIQGGIAKALGVPAKALRSALRVPTKIIFEQLHPRFKIEAFDDMERRAMKYMAKQGKTSFSAEEKKELDRQIGKLVNNMFGGQFKDVQKFWNDPGIGQLMERLVQFPDWTRSAVQEALDTTRKGVGGHLARLNVMGKVGSLFIYSNMLNYLLNGKFIWQEQDPGKRLYHVAYPDLPMEFGGIKYNPGRDENGRREYFHFGKKILELWRYLSNPSEAIYGKSAAPLQIASKQLFGGTPSQGGIYPAQAAFKGGELKPWKGKENEIERFPHRLKELASDVLPFSLRDVRISGILGLNKAKGLSLKTSRPYFQKAIKNHDAQAINALRRVLKGNGYKREQIDRAVSSARTEVRKGS